MSVSYLRVIDLAIKQIQNIIVKRSLKMKLFLRNPTDFQFSLDMSSISNTSQITDIDAFKIMIIAMERGEK
jgi:hypothetical protein